MDDTSELDDARACLLGVLRTQAGPPPPPPFRNKYGLSTIGGVARDDHEVAVDICLEWLSLHATPLPAVVKERSMSLGHLVARVRSWAKAVGWTLHVSNMAFVTAADLVGYVERHRHYNISLVHERSASPRLGESVAGTEHADV